MPLQAVENRLPREPANYGLAIVPGGAPRLPAQLEDLLRHRGGRRGREEQVGIDPSQHLDRSADGSTEGGDVAGERLDRHETETLRGGGRQDEEIGRLIVRGKLL